MQPIRLREVILTLLAAGGAFVLGSAANPITSADFSLLRVGGTNGAAVDGVYRTTATINAASIPPGQASSSDAIAMPGVSTSDHCTVDMVGANEAGATSSVRLACEVTAADVAKVLFYNSTGTAVDLSSAVYSLMVTSF